MEKSRSTFEGIPMNVNLVRRGREPSIEEFPKYDSTIVFWEPNPDP
jgi:hypothetical protein